MALTNSQAALTRDLKHRVLTCLNRLTDRDTYSAAADELESIAKTLPRDSIPPFISSIAATDAADRSPVRKQCLRLVSLLSESHGNTLSPYLSKLISAVIRRLRDPDSAVRSACVTATASIASHITRPPFTSIMNPLVNALVTEQDLNSQIGAALSLSAAIKASPNPDPWYLRKLLPRLEKLLKSNSFKAKPAVLTLIHGIIRAGATSTQQSLKNLVPCLVQFIGSEDWAARKAAAEALLELAVRERDALPEFKAACIKIFDARKFDKVKIVRDIMGKLMEAWKEIPDASDEVLLAPNQPESSSLEGYNDGQHHSRSKTSCKNTSGAPQLRKKSVLVNQSALPDGSNVITSSKRSPLHNGDKKTSPAIFRKLDSKNPTDWKIETDSTHAPSVTVVCENGLSGRDVTSLGKSQKFRSRFSMSDGRGDLVNNNGDDKMLQIGSLRSGSHVVPCHDELSSSTIVVNNMIDDVHRKPKESENISLIREQLVNIENQQSSLSDLLQKYIGSSENGMRSMETRIQVLETALDEISHGLAMTTQEKSNIDSEKTTCCILPGSGFFRSKYWRRTEQHPINRNVNAETFRLKNRNIPLQGTGGFIINPLAEIQRESTKISGASSSRVSKN